MDSGPVVTEWDDFNEMILVRADQQLRNLSFLVVCRDFKLYVTTTCKIGVVYAGTRTRSSSR